MGKRLERPLAAIHLAAKTLPAGNRQQKLDAGTIRHLGGLDDLAPTRGPAFWHAGERQPAVGIHGKYAELEPVGPMQGVNGCGHGAIPALPVVEYGRCTIRNSRCGGSRAWQGTMQ